MKRWIIGFGVLVAAVVAALASSGADHVAFVRHAAAAGDAAGTTELVSVGSAGVQGDRTSGEPAITPDGRFVAFSSIAQNLTTVHQTTYSDVYLHDRATGFTDIVSLDNSGHVGNGVNESPVISDDGRFVAFDSWAFCCVEGVWLRDRDTGTSVRVSANPNGAPAIHGAFDPSISADGRFIAFDSASPNLIAGDASTASEIFLYDRDAKSLEEVSVDSSGNEGNGNSYFPVLSADGRFVAFASDATNLVAADTNGVRDVFVHDMATGSTMRASVDSTGQQANARSAAFGSHPVSISGDGRRVAFQSDASNLTADSNLVTGAYVHDTLTGATVKASGDSSVSASGPGVIEVVISRDARTVTYSGTNPTTRQLGIYVGSLVDSDSELISIGTSGAAANGDSDGPAISGDGRYVSFDSFASNLVPNDLNNTWDVFVRDRCPDGSCVTAPVTPVAIEGDPSPLPGELFGYLGHTSPVENASGELAFTSDSGGACGAFLEAGGSISTLFKQGDALPGTNSTYNCGPANFETSLTDDGTFYFSSQSANGIRGIWAASGGSVSRVALAGDPVVGSPLLLFSGGPLHANNLHSVVFLGPLGGLGSSSSVLLSRRGTTEKIAGFGDPAPGGGTFGGSCGGGISSVPALSPNTDDVYFFAATCGGPSQALYHWSNGVLARVLMTGDAAPGTNGVFSSFDFDRPEIDPSGDIAFRGVADRAPGIWIIRNGTLVPAVLSGEQLPATSRVSQPLSWSLGQDGSIAFSSGPNVGPQDGLFLWNQGTITALALGGQPALGTAGNFTSFFPAESFAGDNVAFLSGTTDPDHFIGIWRASGSSVSHQAVDPFKSTVDLDKSSISADGVDHATLTVTLRDSDGNLITDGRPVSVLSNRENIDVINGPAITGTNGTAQFTITSKIAGYADFTATADGVLLNTSPRLSYIDHAPRKAVIFVQGYASCLNSSATGLPMECLVPGLGGLPGEESFHNFKVALTDVGFDGVVTAQHPYSDFIEFSYDPRDGYAGGKIDPDGNWDAFPYGCADPQSESYSDRADELLYMVAEYHRYHPNTRLSVISHSFGGLVSFQAVAKAEQSSAPLPFDNVVTVDSPLNGMSGPWIDSLKAIATRVILGDCMGSFVKSRATESVHALFGDGKKSASISENVQVKTDALRRSTAIWNVGNDNDCLWNPKSCPLNWQGQLGAIAEASYPRTQYVGSTFNIELKLPLICVIHKACTFDEGGATHTALLVGGVNPAVASTAAALWKFVATCVMAPQLGAHAAPCSAQPK